MAWGFFSSGGEGLNPRPSGNTWSAPPAHDGGMWTQSKFNTLSSVIPTAILLGLFGGLIPRYRWWSVPVIGIVWSITLTAAGDPAISLAQIWIAGFALGAINGAVGVAFTWAMAKAVQSVAQRFRNRTSRLDGGRH